MAYDPNEARDPKGQWTVGSAGVSDEHTHPAGPFMAISDTANGERANQIANTAASVAKKLGYDPSLINISDENRTFELNGKTLPYAGAAHLPPPQGENTTPVKGTITLYTPHVDDASVAGVTAHEVMHQKYQAFLNDYSDDNVRMQKDPAYLASIPKWEFDAEGKPTGKMLSHGTDTFMRPDGSLHEPHASNYPAYTAYNNATKPSVLDFAKSDGVSSYSRDWWDAWHSSTANTSQAMHETLAELARVRYEDKPVTHLMRDVKLIRNEDGSGTTTTGLMKLRKGVDPKWNALYKAVDENWKRRSK